MHLLFFIITSLDRTDVRRAVGALRREDASECEYSFQPLRAEKHSHDIAQPEHDPMLLEAIEIQPATRVVRN